MKRSETEKWYGNNYKLYLLFKFEFLIPAAKLYVENPACGRHFFVAGCKYGIPSRKPANESG